MKDQEWKPHEGKVVSVCLVLLTIGVLWQVVLPPQPKLMFWEKGSSLPELIRNEPQQEASVLRAKLNETRAKLNETRAKLNEAHAKIKLHSNAKDALARSILPTSANGGPTEGIFHQIDKHEQQFEYWCQRSWKLEDDVKEAQELSKELLKKIEEKIEENKKKAK